MCKNYWVKLVDGVKRILDRKTLWFVQSKVTLSQWFCAECEASNTVLLPFQASAEAAGRLSPPWLNTDSVNSAHASVGASAPQNIFAGAWEICSADAEKFVAAEKILALREAEGRRGVHKRICSSGKFGSFIIQSFQFGFNFLQAVAITSGHRVRRHF